MVSSRPVACVIFRGAGRLDASVVETRAIGHYVRAAGMPRCGIAHRSCACALDRVDHEDRTGFAMNASDGPVLDGDEIERYARHLVLREAGGPGQAALKRARVLVIGAGGLGAPALLYLAAAGVGTLGVVDDDLVSLSNLQRQVIHATGDVGRPKVGSAQAAV